MTMREKIARAMCAAAADDYWREPPYNGLHTDKLNNHWRHKADAVLAAMREPTAKMKDAARDVGPDTPSGGFGCDDALRIWQAMIDAASEGKE